MKEQIVELRKEMKKNKIDCYIVMTDDYHGSEYVGDYFKCREYLSGFTGSAGRMVITMEHAILWTDGRYFIQAEEELSGSGIELYKMGEPDVPDIIHYLIETVEENWCIGFDGKTVNARAGFNIERMLRGKKISIKYDIDLIGSIWKGRPKMSCEPVWQLGIRYSGISCNDKINNIRNVMAKRKADMFIISALDEIGWVLNLRGNDIDYNPVFLSYLIILGKGEKKAVLFTQKSAVSQEITNSLYESGIEVMDYECIFNYVKDIEENKNVMLDLSSTSVMLYKMINEKVKINDCISPVMQMKADKNEVEIENERIAHLKDGVAVTKLIYWLKKNIENLDITEMDVSNKLEEIRRNIDNYIEPSFATISAYGSNGAIVHYEPAENKDKRLKASNFILLDMGGHYLEGTTDITRTVSLGTLTRTQRLHYTAVLKGNLKLADATFLYGCRGTNLDCIAREPLWKMGLDFKHGTGHGVGYLLNVHEAPNNFRWKINPMMLNRNDAVLEEGMITSDEPGVYIEGEYGIRLENLVLCKKAWKNQYGQFMKFETLTLVPFDREAIDVESMNSDELQLLNSYHANVYDKISPYLEEDEREWLSKATKEMWR